MPDHKLYFVPVESADEAAFLTAFLNAPQVTRAVSAYAAQLSLGVSVVEYLAIPAYDAQISSHRELAELGGAITREGRAATAGEHRRLDEITLSIVGGHDPEGEEL